MVFGVLFIMVFGVLFIMVFTDRDSLFKPCAHQALPRREAPGKEGVQ